MTRPADPDPKDNDAEPFVTKSRIEEALKEGPGTVRQRDVEELSEREEEIRDRLKRLKKGVFGRAVDEIKLLAGLVRDYATRNYTKVPWKVITIASFSLLYFLNPFDLVPDYIPGVGFIDDVTLVGLAIEAIRDELKKYEDWKKSAGEEPPSPPESR